MYTRNLLWLVSLVSAAPLYAADVPANTPLAPQQVFRYNNHSDPGTLDPQKVEENTVLSTLLTFPPTHRSPRNKSFVTTIIATQARSTRKR